MQSLYSVTTDVKKASEIVIQNMLAVRPMEKVKYRPYYYDGVVTNDSYLGYETVDLKKIYPNVQPGDKAWVGMNLRSGSEYDVALTVTGNAKVSMRLDTEDLCPNQEYSSDFMKYYFFRVRKGSNLVELLCECTSEDTFEVKFVPSAAQYPGMWARDYILQLGVFSPIEAFAAEEGVGVSRLYKKEEAIEREIPYVWPALEKKGNVLDLQQVFPKSKGAVAYALTYALEDTGLHVTCSGKMTAYINGEEKAVNISQSLHKGDTILLKLVKEEGIFEKIIFNEDAAIGIPFLESNRGDGDKWLTLGTFGTDMDADLAYGPELELQFEHPYIDADWKKTFWKLGRKEDFVRPYVDSYFYSQWYYALMVGHYGILRTASLLQNREYQNYFISSISNMARFFEYAGYEYETFKSPTFIGRAAAIDCLDNTGSMAMNLCELYKMTQDERALSCLKSLDEVIREVIPRFEDGTFNRKKTMWADDVFMCCPMLVRMGLVFHNPKYFKEVLTQIQGFKKRLWREDAKLFSHILFIDEGHANEISWSRGNGWIYTSLGDLMEYFPEEEEGKAILKDIFVEFSESLVNYQDEDGLWHQVIDYKDSYSETSGSAMFLWGMSRGIRMGILPVEKYGPVVKRTYEGLLKNMLDADGNVYGVCRGSGLSMNVEYYKRLGSLYNDDHGTGLILAAFEAYSRIEGML